MLGALAITLLAGVLLAYVSDRRREDQFPRQLVGVVPIPNPGSQQTSSRVHGDAGYVGAQAYVGRADRIEWKIARRRGQVAKIRNARERARVIREETRKAQVRARVEHPFRVVKCVFGYAKTRFKGLAKNTVQIMTLFALANLYAARKHLLQQTGQLRPQFG